MAAAGAAYIDKELFNGRWFIQKIDLGDKSVLAPFDTGRKAGVLADGFMETYWSDEFGELKYQMAEGCISDQILGQWHAEVAGLGGFLDEDHVRTALKAVHDNNFRADLSEHFNPCRNYAFEDEGGLLVATYPVGVRQPMVAAPYAEEVWTGVEYMSASHMIMRGLVDEGLEIVRAARDRHDGAQAQPVERHRVRLLLRPLDVGLAARQRLLRPPGRLRRRPPRLRPEADRRLPPVLVRRHRLRPARAEGRRPPRGPRRHAPGGGGHVDGHAPKKLDAPLAAGASVELA